MKKIRYFCEAALLYMLFFLFRLMPVDMASNTGGWIGRTIGPRLAASRKGYKNLNHALPGLNRGQQDRIIKQVWDNLGRIIAEYPHLEKICRERVTIKGEDLLAQAVAENKGGIFLSGHLGNWEINGPYLVTIQGLPGGITYRAPNNPWTGSLLQKARSMNGRVKALPKARSSGKKMIQAIKNGEFLGILIDQKYNEGEAIDFFGHPAMTNPVAVELCQKYKAPLIPFRNRRLNGARFELEFFEPLKIFDEDGTPLPVETVIKTAHVYLEDWVRDDPGQWIWLHRRWDSDAVKNTGPEND